MKEEEASTSLDSDSPSYYALSPIEKRFADEMLKRAIEVCALLGICEKCASDLGTCEHTKLV